MAKKRTRKTSRARSIGRRMGAGLRGTAINAGAGALTYFGTQELGKRVAFCRQKWWATPAILAVAGHLMKKRPRLAGIGTGLTFCAGYVGALTYSLHKQAAAQAPAPETSMLRQPAEVSMLVDPSAPALPEQTVSTAMNIGRRRLRAVG